MTHELSLPSDLHTAGNLVTAIVNVLEGITIQEMSRGGGPLGGGPGGPMGGGGFGGGGFPQF